MKSGSRLISMPWPTRSAEPACTTLINLSPMGTRAILFMARIASTTCMDSAVVRRSTLRVMIAWTASVFKYVFPVHSQYCVITVSISAPSKRNDCNSCSFCGSGISVGLKEGRFWANPSLVSAEMRKSVKILEIVVLVIMLSIFLKMQISLVSH